MTNEELKKRIMETIDNSVDDWAIRDKRGRIHVYIEKIADALIAAGIGDVKRHRVFVSKDGKEVKQLYNGEEVEQIVKEREEYKHRAEVAERALDRACEKVFLLSDNCRYSNLKDDVRDSIKLRRSDVENFIAVVREKFLQQAEKELAEEKK